MFRARALFCENKVSKLGSRLGRGHGRLPGAIVEPFWVACGAILEPPGSSKIVLPSRRELVFSKIRSLSSGSFPGRLRGAILEPPGTSPEAPRIAPGAPGETQKRPRRVQMSSRRRKKGSQKEFGVRLAFGEALGIDFGASGDRFGTLWGSILDQFWCGFGLLPAETAGEGA